MTRRLSACVLLVLLGTAPAPAETLDTPSCQSALAATWTSMKETLARLRSVAKASKDDRCAAFNHHVEVVMNAREVFARCKTGRDRDGDLAQMDGALDDVKNVINRDCAGQ